MNIIFAGTPSFTLPILQTLLVSRHDIVAVYTRSDKPAGRGLKYQDSSLKHFALAQGLALEQPETFTAEVNERLASYRPDLLITMSYGLLLPEETLRIPSLGSINIHTSLLPRWRGAAPIARAIEAGDDETGISLMRMEAQLDAGPLICQRRYKIKADDTTASLQHKLCLLSTEAVAQLLNGSDNAIQTQFAQAQPQTQTEVCYAKKLNKQEAWINWHQTAESVARKIRAYNPWPVAQTYFNNRSLRIWTARTCRYDIAPARITTTKRNVYAGCADGALELLVVQLPGGKPMDGQAFVAGHPVKNKPLLQSLGSAMPAASRG